MYFDKPGPDNTENTLRIAFTEAKKRKIENILLASTTGETAGKALEYYQKSNVRLIVVTHNYGFVKPGEQQFSPAVHQELVKEGVIVHTGTMVLRNQGTAIRKKFGYSQEELINAVLRMIGQGVKVGIEMAAMACDAGLVPPQDVITIAGTSRGADTALVVAANSSNRFFDIRVREILAKPR
ncbi:hypothetical protein JXQ31_03565 [candidate division KSB1 bacterium]|nr:hypothetical protein [candidate division KSB1 bacterium]